MSPNEEADISEIPLVQGIAVCNTLGCQVQGVPFAMPFQEHAEPPRLRGWCAPCGNPTEVTEAGTNE